MIPGEEIVGAADLLTLAKESFGDGRSGAVAFLGQIGADSDESLVAQGCVVGQFQNANAPPQPVILEMGGGQVRAVPALGDGNQAIRGIPGVGGGGACGGIGDGGQVAVGVIGQGLGHGAVGHGNLVAVGGAVAGKIRRGDRNHVVTRSHFRKTNERGVRRVHDGGVGADKDIPRFVGQLTGKPHAPAVDHVRQLIQRIKITGRHPAVNLFCQTISNRVVAVEVALENCPCDAIAVDGRTQQLVHRVVIQPPDLRGGRTRLLGPGGNLAVGIVGVLERREWRIGD